MPLDHRSWKEGSVSSPAGPTHFKPTLKLSLAILLVTHFSPPSSQEPRGPEPMSPAY